MGRLYADACGRYVFAGDATSGSRPVWLIKYNRERDLTYADLRADHAGYAEFKAFRERCIYGCNTARVDFYEETPFHPDYLLSDLIQILHPELGGLGGLRYFCKLKDE